MNAENPLTYYSVCVTTFLLVWKLRPQVRFGQANAVVNAKVAIEKNMSDCTICSCVFIPVISAGFFSYPRCLLEKSSTM